MTHADFLRTSFVALEVNEAFTEAVVRLHDGSRLDLCHRVGERWVRATGPEGATRADTILAQIALFRLNGKHLDIHFADGSRWEAPFRAGGGRA
jgi:hypothetical protein